MLVEGLEKSAGRSIGGRECLVELAENDRARPKTSFQAERTALRWKVDLAMKTAMIALRQAGKLGSHIGAERAVMTLDGDASNLEGETLDGLLGMEHPS